MTVNLFNKNSDWKVFLGEMLSEEENKKFTRLLRQNADVFAWKHFDVKGVHSSIAYHHLNMKGEWRSTRQKLWKFHEEWHKIITEEVERLLEANLSGKCSTRNG